MRRALRPALLLLLALAPVAAAATGPYVGVLRAGEQATHAYDNHPSAGEPPCPDYFAPVWWTVTLQYAPATARVTLDVPGRAGPVNGTAGAAVLSFEGGGCEAFDVVVTALSSPTAVAYAAEVGMHTTAPA